MSEHILEIDDVSLCRRICGKNDTNIRIIESLLGAVIIPRGNSFIVRGEGEALDRTLQALHLLSDFLHEREEEYEFSEFDLRYIADSLVKGKKIRPSELGRLKFFFKEKKRTIVPKTANQAAYITSIHENPVTFGIGPAGTGKTYLAVVVALYYFLKGSVDRLVLTRPAVEAGESLGFLPGDLAEKINPYLRPLYDALFDLMPPERIARLIEDGRIEIAPLAYMRGRTLNRSVIILDEAQNTTRSQMKMFLTRLGESSKFIITGDVTQIDLNKSSDSGLLHAIKILKNIDGISFNMFNIEDISRHPVVQKIVTAYEESAEAGR